MDSISLARDFTPLASSAVSLELDHVPDDVLEHTIRVVADTVGVVLGGAKRPEIEAYARGDGVLFRPIADGGERSYSSPGFRGRTLSRPPS